MIIFVTATDTGVGKSYATGLLARSLLEAGLKVITQKPVQTGARFPEDLWLHRELMKLPPDPPELLSLTNPYLLAYPASPRTAALVEGKQVSLLKLKEALLALEERFEVVLVEGAGGILVPFTPHETFLDFISFFMAPVVVVTPARLGTINHTLLTIEALKRRGLVVLGLVYNLFEMKDEFLAQESLEDIKKWTEIDNILTLPPLEKPEIPPQLLKEAQNFLKPYLSGLV